MSRRSGAAFLVPLLGVLVFAVVTLDNRFWGQWLWAADLISGLTVLSGPLVAACAAHLGWIQTQLDDLVRTTPRARRVPLRCAFQAWLWGGVGFALSAAAIVLATLLRPHGGPFPLWAAAIGLPVLGVSALFGALAVRVLPSRLTVIAVAPAVFLVGAFGPAPYAELLRQGPSTGSLAGLRFDRSVWLLQFGGLLAVAGVLAAALVVAGGRVRAVRGLLLPAGVALGSLGVLVTFGAALGEPGRDRLVVSEERPTVCRGVKPTICVAPSSVYGLRATETTLRRALGHLRAVGAEPPDRYEQALPGYLPPPSVGVVSVEDGDLRAAARSAATPAGCPQWRGSLPPEKALMAQELIGLWIRGREGEQVVSWTAKGDAWLKRVADPGAEAWIRRTYAQLGTCDFQHIRMPWTSPAGR